MEIKQLEAFTCVARTRSFSKAAEKMYVSQPTVSSSISSLEKDLNVQLLVRNNKEVTLTKAGQDFLIYAQKILAIKDQALNSINGDDRNMLASIDIISSTIPAQHLLPEIIASFHKQWPNILFRVDQASSQQVERKMSDFRFDFGMVGTMPDDGRFIHCPVYDDELVLVTANKTPESPEMIREGFADFIKRVTFIAREPGSGTRAEVESLLTRLGVDPKTLRVGAYFADAHSILLAVSRGMGASLIPKVAAAMYVEAGLLQAVEMRNSLFRRQIHLLYNKERWLSPVQKAFADYAGQFYRHRQSGAGAGNQ
jgi:DNA-binding transcriptional LysR family regulator